MRIVFLGSGEFGLPLLKRLCDEHEVALVISQPDRPAGRKRKLTPTPIALEAGQRGIPTIKPEKANADDVLRQVRDAKADAMVVVAFGQYLSQQLVNIPRLGAVNLHGSLLPRWRGASPINAAILHGDTQTGNTVIRLAPKMDAGEMLGSQTVPIDPLQTAGELHDRLAAIGPELVMDVLRGLDAGSITPTPQDESKVTLAPKLSKADGYVDFTADATTIRCRVHGLTPWPGVTVRWGEPSHELILRRVEDLPDHQHTAQPGTLLDDHGVIAAGKGALRLLEVQPPGKRVMNWDEFARGHAIGSGARFVRVDAGE